MVKKRVAAPLILSLLLTLMAPFLHAVGAFNPGETELTYHVDWEYAEVWIRKDGSIDLYYNITITCDQGSIGILTVGMPNPFTITYVHDDSGAPLKNEDVSKEEYYGVDVHLKQRIYSGSKATFTLLASVEEMVWEETTERGNVGVQFKPVWWENPPAPIHDLRVAMVLPEGVKQGEIETSVHYDRLYAEDNIYVVYWERRNLQAGAKFTCGVSFPKGYVDKYYTGGVDWFFIAILAVLAAVMVIIAILVISRSRRAIYERPRIMVEALGPARGLTAVEAAVVIDSTPVKVLTMILFSLLFKGIVRVRETEPLIKLERVDAQRDVFCPSCGGENPAGARFCVGCGRPLEVERERPLRYYEIDFLNALKPDGSLDERQLARCYLGLSDNVDKKLRGYSRADTVKYYGQIVDRAWDQVTQADTSQLRGEALEKNLEWLLLDEECADRFGRAFPSDAIIIPHPDWYWYWRGPYPTRGRITTPRPAPVPHPNHTPRPTPAPTEFKPLPAQEFADGIVTGLENAANGLVKDAEGFAEGLLKSKTKRQSTKPVHQGSSCVCACAHCACACACVSCACACAGGGAR